jgi:hypothetical protein
MKMEHDTSLRTSVILALYTAMDEGTLAGINIFRVDITYGVSNYWTDL